MNKYGEITRIKHNGISYILAAEKIQSSYLIDDPFIPFLAFYRTNKTSKKVFSKNVDKYDRAHQLSDNLFSSEIIEKIIDGFKRYLETIKPLYLGYYKPYGRFYEAQKRHKYYEKILNQLGYIFIGKCTDTYGYECFYYQKKIT